MSSSNVKRAVIGLEKISTCLLLAVRLCNKIRPRDQSNALAFPMNVSRSRRQSMQRAASLGGLGERLEVRHSKGLGHYGKKSGKAGVSKSKVSSRIKLRGASLGSVHWRQWNQQQVPCARPLSPICKIARSATLSPCQRDE